jgi:acetyl-CoA carboxylase biotin carboxyl carrier protein
MTRIKSEMAGTLIELKVKPGDKVVSGQEVAVLESMKMEVPLVSPISGTVSSCLKSPGDFVNDGDGVIELKPEGS